MQLDTTKLIAKIPKAMPILWNLSCKLGDAFQICSGAYDVLSFLTKTYENYNFTNVCNPFALERIPFVYPSP